MTAPPPGAGDPCDVLVIGGGPAGSTAAALLAEQGRDVVLLEQGSHPRFHVGESLLPLNLPILDRLGVREEIHAMGVFKPGAEMISEATGRSVDFNFATGLDRVCTHSYQVRRAQFDAALFANAGRRGARTLQQARVTQVDLPAASQQRARVLARRDDGTTACFAPRFVLDASGRETFLAGRLRARQADKTNNTAAVYAHFRRVACRDDEMAGCVSVHLAADGWFWVIPLPEGIASVGFVGTQAAFKRRTAAPGDFLLAQIHTAPRLQARMHDAELVSEVMTAANYSYRAGSCWGERYMLIGDAYAFIDPVFSSGVLLAMTSAMLGAEVADAWLDDAARGRRLARAAERRLRHGMDRLNWLIYRINDPVLRFLLLRPNNRFHMRDGLISLLAGNLDDTPGLRLPVLAFKGVYHLLSLAGRLGLRLPEAAT